MLFRAVVGAVLLALLAAPAVLAQTVAGDGGSGASASGFPPMMLMLGVGAAGLAVAASAVFYAYRH